MSNWKLPKMENPPPPPPKYTIAVDFGDSVNHAACIIAKEENSTLVVIDSLVSKDSDDVKRKIEEYEPNYFSLDSIHQRLMIAMGRYN